MVIVVELQNLMKNSNLVDIIVNIQCKYVDSYNSTTNNSTTNNSVNIKNIQSFFEILLQSNTYKIIRENIIFEDTTSKISYITTINNKGEHNDECSNKDNEHQQQVYTNNTTTIITTNDKLYSEINLLKNISILYTQQDCLQLLNSTEDDFKLLVTILNEIKKYYKQQEHIEDDDDSLDYPDYPQLPFCYINLSFDFKKDTTKSTTTTTSTDTKILMNPNSLFLQYRIILPNTIIEDTTNEDEPIEYISQNTNTITLHELLNDFIEFLLYKPANEHDSDQYQHLICYEFRLWLITLLKDHHHHELTTTSRKNTFNRYA